jgi:AcrR family transcriptional regulator
MGQNSAKLTREMIVEAAMSLTGAQGLDGLTMRKLAGNLGVQAMSLYNHIANREDLLDSLVERVVSEYEVPQIGSGWKIAMRRRAHSVHEVLLRYPWVITLILTRRNSGPHMFRFVNATLGVLVSAGFSYGLADYAWNSLDNHIYGYTIQEVYFPIEQDEYADVAREYQDRINTGEYPFLAEISALIMKGEYSGIHEFEFGLDIILDGLDGMISH